MLTLPEICEFCRREFQVLGYTTTAAALATASLTNYSGAPALGDEQTGDAVAAGVDAFLYGYAAAPLLDWRVAPRAKRRTSNDSIDRKDEHV